MNKFDFSGTPLPERPLMIIRLRFGHEEPEVWKRTFEQLKRNRPICDEVWFSTGIGFPVLDEHRRYSELMAQHAEDLRSADIIPSLQIQATIGHSDRITASAGAAGKTWSSFVCNTGDPCKYINCPSQPGFLEYMAELSRIYAQWQPGSVWIDDDLRLCNHSPEHYCHGCHCPDCLKKFAVVSGKLYSREELVALCETDKTAAEQWDKFATDTICNVAKVILNNVKSISPGSRFGMQHCSEPARLAIHDTLNLTSGKRSGSRPGGGASSDHDPNMLIDKAFSMSRQIYTQQDYSVLDQLCPEIESYPRNFCCKTPQGLRIETMLYLALGADSMSYFILDPLCETPEWYGENLLAPLAKDAPHYKEFINSNLNTLPGGLARLEKNNPGISIHDIGLPLIGIPQAGASPAACCGMLTETALAQYSDEEAAEIFKGNIIMDGAAAMALQQRGLSGLIDGVKISKFSSNLFDFCTDDPLNSGIENRKNFPWSEDRFIIDIPENVSARVLTVYRENDGSFAGNATVIFERACGSRIAIVGYAGFHTRYAATSRVTMLMRIVDWISHHALPVLPLEPVQAMIVPRITAGGVPRTVTILNPTIGTNREFKLQLRNIPENIDHILWQIPGEKTVALQLHKTGSTTYVNIPQLGGWEIGFITIAEN